MAAQHLPLKGDLIRYLDGDLGPEDKRKIEAHLNSCTECQERVSFAHDFNRGLGQLSVEELSPQEPCPDANTLVRYEAGDLDQETVQHLRAHMLFCSACRDDYYALRRLSHQESWQALLERHKEFIIDLATSYGPGALVGPVRIVSEQPAYALRGGELAKAISKALEFSLGENTYSMEVAGTEDGSLSCDIAGIRTPLQEPLTILAQSGTGAELHSVQTDKYGNADFMVPRPATEAPETLVLFTFTLKDLEVQVLVGLANGPGQQ